MVGNVDNRLLIHDFKDEKWTKLMMAGFQGEQD
jgi:hypothetical protein